VATLSMKDVTLFPTNHCFDDALDYIEFRLKENPKLGRTDRLKLVHGICLMPEGPRAGTPYAHAWVQETTPESVQVWQGALLEGHRVFFSVSLEDFTANYRPQDVTVYTLQEACRANDASGHYGPWVERYQALCRNAGAKEASP
jgi:hypothetical protein